MLARRAMNDLSRTAQRNIGVKRSLDLVPSERSERRLRQFINAMPARLRWTPWERTVNLFSFWVENHPRKNLKFEIAAFISDHEMWMPSLTLWENETMDQMRSLNAVESIEEPKAPQEPEDPRIGELASFTYELTGVLPALVHMTKLLAVYDISEIKDAVKEYSDLLGEKELKAGMKSFFADGGAVAVIHSRRKKVKQ